MHDTRQPPRHPVPAREDRGPRPDGRGRTNFAIASELVLSAGAVEKHVANIFAKLELWPTAHDHRRVLAVLAYVGAKEPARLAS